MHAKRVVNAAKRSARSALRRTGFDITRTISTQYLITDVTAGAPLPQDSTRLEELRSRYRLADPAVIAHTYWNDGRVASRTFVDTQRFRAESMYVWQYIDDAATVKVQRAEYQYFIYLQYLERLDDRALLSRVSEDGAFGAPMFRFPGRAPVSRDVLDSVNEILFLDRALGILDRSELRVLDVGAGYGRLAHRMAQMVPGLADYACTDAIPESTYVCERYLAYRGVQPPCRVIELPDVEQEVRRSPFDLAVNIHSFSEMPATAIEYWVRLMAGGQISHLLVVPNDPNEVRSYEADGSRMDMLATFEEVGYELTLVEPVITDRAVRELYGVHDHYHLFHRRT